MRIGLMSYVPDDLICGSVKDIMQSYGQFNNPEAWGKMPPGFRDRFDNNVPEFLREKREFSLVQFLEIPRTVDLV
jgi:hypothetical protein